jgi:hypothetical protein
MSEGAFKGRPPDLILKAKSKASGGGRRIGAGWVNDNGKLGQTVSIQLDTCVTISWNDDVFLLLVPSKEEARE